MINKRDKAILKKYSELVKNKKTIGFCVSIEHADYCAKIFREAGYKSISIHSENKDIFKDKSAIERFHIKSRHVVKNAPRQQNAHTFYP
jgi:superfamily II DNA/RNA helicase